jgi:hypothetical protein
VDFRFFNRMYGDFLFSGITETVKNNCYWVACTYWSYNWCGCIFSEWHQKYLMKSSFHKALLQKNCLWIKGLWMLVRFKKLESVAELAESTKTSCNRTMCTRKFQKSRINRLKRKMPLISSEINGIFSNVRALCLVSPF